MIPTFSVCLMWQDIRVVVVVVVVVVMSIYCVKTLTVLNYPLLKELYLTVIHHVFYDGDQSAVNLSCLEPK